MRSLAEFVMRGRSQAVGVAAFSTATLLFAWLGAAVVALVTLRKGAYQGVLVMIWALLPALLYAQMGDIGPLTTLIGALLVASVLRVSAYWPFALLVAVLCGGLTGLLMLSAAGQAYVAEILRVTSEFLAQLQHQAGEDAALAVVTPTALQIAGLLGLSATSTIVACVLLARWWQSTLYNPGAFRSEFLALRMPPLLTVLLLAGIVGLSSQGTDYRFWALILVLPFVITGFALAHAVVASKKLGGTWLGLFYLCWVLLDPLKVLLVAVVVADSWLNIRARLASR